MAVFGDANSWQCYYPQTRATLSGEGPWLWSYPQPLLNGMQLAREARDAQERAQRAEDELDRLYANQWSWELWMQRRGKQFQKGLRVLKETRRKGRRMTNAEWRQRERKWAVDQELADKNWQELLDAADAEERERQGQEEADLLEATQQERAWEWAF